MEGSMMKTLRPIAAALLLAAAASPAPAASPEPAVAPPGAFSLTAPADGATNVPLLPTLTWTASAGVSTYTLEAASDAAFTTIVLSQVGITTTSYTPGAPIAQGVTVFWRVTALNAGGSTLATGAPFSFTTVTLPPGAFTLTAPADTATGVALQPTFTWGASTGAVSYTLEVSTDSGFSAVVVTQSGLVVTNFQPGAPLTGGTSYFWRVRAINAGGSTVATGAPFSFLTVTTGPGPFTLVYPSDGSFGVDPNTFFLWNDATGVSTYTLDVATDAAFTSIVFEVTGIPGSSFGSTLNLAPMTTYYWRVTAVNGTGSTMASAAPFQFQTDSTSGSGGGGGSGAVGFSGSTGGCGLLGLEWLVPCGAVWFARRRFRKG
jgi:hypothetical protein